MAAIEIPTMAPVERPDVVSVSACMYVGKCVYVVFVNVRKMHPKQVHNVHWMQLMDAQCSQSCIS